SFVSRGRRTVIAPLSLHDALPIYPSFRIDCALIRCTASDPRGNLSTHREAFHHELLAMAQAAHNSGGIVIAQVESIVDYHQNLQDRKSTRLNSSHVTSSYAVFCLR